MPRGEGWAERPACRTAPAQPAHRASASPWSTRSTGSTYSARKLRRRPFGNPIVTVRALGAPDVIYVDDGPPARVSVVYGARPGLPPGTAGVGALLDEIQGDATAFKQKTVAGGVPITPVRVNGERGYFIGGSHTVNLPDELRPRVAGNTVVWLHDAVTYRLETKLEREAAVRLAQIVG